MFPCRPMEQLEIHEGYGQSYGYLIYRKTLTLTPGKRRGREKQISGS